MAVDAAQAAGEQAGGDNSHISYVKHLSSDQAAPGESSGDGSQDGSFIDKIPGGWWTVGIGAATVIIGLLTLAKMNKGNTAGTSSTIDPSGSSAYYPVDTTGGNSVGYDSTPGALDPQISGLLSQEQINQMSLQSILNQLGNSGSSKTSGGSSSSGSSSGSYSPRGWIYTIKKGDTLNKLNQFAKWGSLNSLNQSGNNVYKYSDNNVILQNYGITGVNQQLPVGVKIRL